MFDQVEQAELVHGPERIGPPKFLDCVFAVVGRSEQDGMEVSDGGDVPGVTDQAAHTKAEWVVEKVADNDFNDFLGKPAGRGQGCGGSFQRCVP
jgi:hypothetical protein